MSPLWAVPRRVVDAARAALNRLQGSSTAGLLTVAGAPRPCSQAVTPRYKRLAEHVEPLVQPDRTSCGSSCLVVLRVLRDPASADAVLGAFGPAALGVRRRTNALLDADHRLQLPWPAALGVRPAAMVRLLEADAGFGAPGVRYRNRVLDPHHLERGYVEIRDVVSAGEPVPLYVGDGRWMQHIVLVVDADEDALHVYDPAIGRLVVVPRGAFSADRISVAGWSRPWLAILPR